MVTGITITVAFLIGFWVGTAYGQTSRYRRGAVLLKTFVSLIAIVATIGAVLGLIAFISPTAFMGLMAKLPSDLQEFVFWEFLFGGGSRWLWGFGILAGVMWWLQSRI